MSLVRGLLKRALWCRWFHRWRCAHYSDGWSRRFCAACKDRDDYGERHMYRVEPWLR